MVVRSWVVVSLGFDLETARVERGHHFMQVRGVVAGLAGVGGDVSVVEEAGC